MVKLVGQLEPDAQKLIKAQGLLLGDRSTKVNVEQAGRVVEQKPPAGAKVRPGDTVAIVVATDDKVDVPSVLGMTPKDAEVALLKAELKPGKITEAQVAAEKAGSVLNQTPVAGDRAPRKSEVAMEVGVAKRQVVAPEFDPKLGAGRRPRGHAPARRRDRRDDRSHGGAAKPQDQDDQRPRQADRDGADRRARQARHTHARRDRPHDRGAEEGAQGTGREQYVNEPRNRT